MSMLFLTFKRFKSNKDYYSILGVNYNSSPKDIKESFLKLSKIYHPDNNATGNHVKFVQIKEAYDAIKDIPPSKQPRQSFTSHTQYRRPLRPLNMSHIQSVYKTIRDEPEVPKFRPFENHNYPNTDFNRFEYSREWDKNKKAWVYMRRPTAKQYERQMNANHKKLRRIISFAMFCLILQFIIKFV